MTKCITFDPAAQSALPQHIKDKMKADREKARRTWESNHCQCEPPVLSTDFAYEYRCENCGKEPQP